MEEPDTGVGNGEVFCWDNDLVSEMRDMKDVQGKLGFCSVIKSQHLVTVQLTQNTDFQHPSVGYWEWTLLQHMNKSRLW